MAAIAALKRLQHAKSRMAAGPGELSEPLRRRLAQTMAFDTLEALTLAADRVVVVTDQPAFRSIATAAGIEVDVVAERGTGGLNAAFDQGARWLQVHHAPTLVVAAVADLPALRPTTLTRVFTAAARYERAFVADASGIGTTMLTMTSENLDPRFQGRSAAAHRSSGAHPITADETDGPIADARRDVDTLVDLYDAWGLGLGSRTARLLDGATGQLLDHDVVTVTAKLDQVITSRGGRATFEPDAWPAGQLSVSPGQRLHAVLADDVVVSSWH